MIVYLVRHGIAEEIDPKGQMRDAERALTAEGRRKTREVARGLRALGAAPARIGASPLVRARQTAEILRDVLAAKRAIEACGFLAQGPETARAVRWLRERRCASAMLVGHFPYLAETASELLGRTRAIRMTLKRSAVCCISFDGAPAAGRGKLEWLLQPRHLRALAR